MKSIFCAIFLLSLATPIFANSELGTIEEFVPAERKELNFDLENFKDSLKKFRVDEVSMRKNSEFKSERIVCYQGCEKEIEATSIIYLNLKINDKQAHERTCERLDATYEKPEYCNSQYLGS